jgi:hypothetical protein
MATRIKMLLVAVKRLPRMLPWSPKFMINPLRKRRKIRAILHVPKTPVLPV